MSAVVTGVPSSLPLEVAVKLRGKWRVQAICRECGWYHACAKVETAQTHADAHNAERHSGVA